jgi:glycosyltransferase involved in cell wall biosynthesis
MSRAIVVVPCYNEAKRLNLRAIQEYGRRADAAELLFVNDGSRDETLELLEHLNRSNPRRFSFLHLAKNGGKAEAVRQGVLMAIGAGADYVGFWDADLATPLADIEPFCRILDGKPAIDLVVGTRMRLLGHAIERKPLRHALGRLFANVASLALGVKLFDTQCGAKLFRVTPNLARLFERPFQTKWIFDVELLARMKQARQVRRQPLLESAIYEFPLDSWRDVAGSNVKGRDFVKASFELAGICWSYLRPAAPLFGDVSDVPGSLAKPLPNAAKPQQPPTRGDQRAA